jgi:hypothetical protein
MLKYVQDIEFMFKILLYVFTPVFFLFIIVKYFKKQTYVV